MFFGLTSIGNNVVQHEFAATQEEAQQGIVDANRDKLEGRLKDLTSTLTEIADRVGAVEDELPQTEPSTTDDVPMKLLPSTSTLVEVISAVNELIKRDFNKV